ncbi:uncharacterized protein PAC_00128 [Phialocephala subalpina]|uniref:Zn(2)-C6 fungal-type domain-containing protein n=1 Tax=Phialocephala subalpina TaxID=576137 RepID=A0A1L7WBV2_9HELO|nr:uncharacterized protein PAC_00128 [Phialocephala subalpina]
MTEPEPERRRRRPTVSCTLCRKRKIRCNREIPCNNCIRSRNGTCVYEHHPPLPQRQRPGHAQNAEHGPVVLPTRDSIIASRASSTSKESTAPSSQSKLEVDLLNTSTPAAQSSASYIKSTKSIISQLEKQHAIAASTSTQSPPATPDSSVETTTSRLGGTFHVHRESHRPGQPAAITRSVTHKTRSFGQSHWINVVTTHYQDLIDKIEPLIREEESKVILGLQKCKRLAKIVKARRAPAWPTLPISELPSKEVADELIECYLRTSETIYRVLHIPSFRRDYEALWLSAIDMNTPSLVQVKLVLAIGAATYDEQFSLRASAIQWVYEAQNWLSQPNIKSQLGIQSLQTSLLLLLARENVDVGGDLIWIDAGALLRRAVYMGLHKDPARLPKMTKFAAEMRRRLWNTILEITLQSSLTSGGPPFVSVDDFDTLPPSNFDDDQLIADDPSPKLEEDFTQVSIAIALRKTFPIRLGIAKFLNDMGSHGTYEDTLRLDAELRTSYKALCRAIQGWRLETGCSPSQFALGVVDFLMHRYISALHIPFFAPALHEAAYAWSRKVVIESSLKIWYTLYPSASIIATQSRDGTDSSNRDDLARLTVTGSVFYKTVAIQATMLIAMELRAQLKEQDSLSPLPLRPDLLSILEGTKAWCLRCIEAGETNIKGYLITCLVVAQIDGLMRGVREDEFPELLIEAVQAAEDRCLPILEEMATQGQHDRGADEFQQMSLNTPFEMAGDWDFLMSDALNPGNADPMSWMFNDELTQEPLLWR